MKNSRIIKNIIILIIAPFIAWGLLFLMNNFSWLTASVLDIWEVQKVKDEWWDLAYKTEWWIFEIFWSEKVQASDNIVVKVLYNPDKIVLDSWLLSWINHEIISDNTWNLEVSYTWDGTQILLGDSRKVNQKWEKELLSIWNLNNSEEHSILP